MKLAVLKPTVAVLCNVCLGETDNGTLIYGQDTENEFQVCGECKMKAYRERPQGGVPPLEYFEARAASVDDANRKIVQYALKLITKADSL